MPDDTEQVRALVVRRYGRLAEAAAADERVTDGGPGEGCFGAAAYDDTAGLPRAALRASLGCGNPVAVAALEPGETVLDLGSGGGLDVLLSARRVGPAGRVYGLDASPEMVSLARARVPGPAPGDRVHPDQHRPGRRRGGRPVLGRHPGRAARRPAGVLIRPMRAADAAPVLAIYQAGLDTGQASFETAAPAWEAFDAARLPLHRHVAVSAATGRVLGWTAASPVSGRCVYAGVIEHSVYVDPRHHGKGIGGALLGALVASSEDAGIWTVQSGVFPENTASLALHERAGFRVVGVRERVGCHHGRWRDTVLVERRSRVTGAG